MRLRSPTFWRDPTVEGFAPHRMEGSHGGGLRPPSCGAPIHLSYGDDDDDNDDDDDDDDVYYYYYDYYDYYDYYYYY